MPILIAAAGFLGAWLLLAGPVFQAALELTAEEIDRDAIAASTRSLPPPPPVSPWWWLLPPVGYVLNRRRGHRHREAIIGTLDTRTTGQLVRFMDKATGWLLVAGGAFLIALKETWELVEALELPVAVWVAASVVMFLLATGFTPVHLRHSRAALAGRSAAGAAAR